MSTTESITKAIAAHGLWKTRLKEAVATGSSLFRPDAVKLDNACDFGKWLYSMTPAQRDAGWEKIKGLHAAFHLEASKILALALTGKKAEAETAMGTGTPFAVTSAALVNELQAWKP